MKLKNIKKPSKGIIAASLLWSSLPLMGSGFFVVRNEENEDVRRLINDIRTENIPSFDFYMNADILNYNDPRFDEGRTLLMEIIRAAKGGSIRLEIACYFILRIAGKYPNILNAKDRNGKNLLDYAIEANLVDLVDIILDSPGLMFSVCSSSEEQFMDIIIRSGNLRLLSKAISNELPEDQAPILLKYAQERLVDNLNRIGRGSLDYCAFAKNCSSLMIMLSNWIVEEANTRNEKELIEAICDSDPEKICRLLAIDGLNINYQDRRGRTPLMWAVVMGDLATVVEILDKRPDLELCNREGKTVFNIADQNPSRDIQSALHQLQF
ncbi:MAG: ankyrin repeat domain-containing protein [Puniceicoccales bacterium]|jgi:ankyrin repeat protein|nr:ankyrin repeat domain-containing protein [Puniceicoccales bacterium]